MTGSSQYGIVVPSDMKVTSRKSAMIDALDERASLPTTYSSSTAKEETLLEYVEDFRRQFVQVFPDRRPLILCPLNEAGVRKFVCTTVRPTLLPYNAVYDMQDTANFVSDFLKYLELDVPTKLPDMLPSPSTTITLRSGDCIDFANLLVSLLRGAAYDAYVVSGYAPKWVCVQDQSMTTCPLLDETENPLDKEKRLETEKSTRDRLEKEKNSVPVRKEETQEGEESPNKEDGGPKEKYPVKKQPDHNSKFLAMREREIKEEEANKTKEMESKAQFVSDTIPDPLHGNRVHCWVLVKAGKRDLEESFFIEPTTGTIFPIKSSPYLGIESVWNEQNYWANVQTATPQEMNFDLKDSNSWEYVLIEDPSRATASDDTLPFGEGTTTDMAAAEVTPEEAPDDRDILDCPMSWCSNIVIDRLVFRDRYPMLSRSIHYRKCTMQMFSEHRTDKNGLVLRIMLFQTEECITPVEIREKFKHRQDFLHSRYVYPLAGRVHMMFEKGRKHGLKDYIVMEKQRSFTFYPKARVDGMVRRNTLIGRKVVEEFEERDDFLIYRSVKVAVDKNNPVSSYLVELAPRSEVEGGGVPVLKITQKFARNEKMPAEQDVRKRTHFIADQKIRLDYHFAKRSITATSLLLDKNDRQIGSDTLGDLDYSSGRNRDNPSEKPNPFAKEHKELLAKLVIKEKDMLSEVRDDEKEMTQLLKELDSEAHDVRLEKDIYDLAQEQAKDEEKEREDQIDEKLDKNKVDYLSPFLAQYKGTLDHRQAMQAKDECLAALKERLLERANIIQLHLDDENQKLHQRRTMFKRQTGSGAVEADEEFTKFYEQAAFRIDILRARLARHEDLALNKYVQMDHKLNNDPRLRNLKQNNDGHLK